MRRTQSARIRDYLLVALAVLLIAATRCMAGAELTPAHQEEVQGVLTLLAVVGEEYREGLDDRGALARPLEYAEARSFLAEARQRWERLDRVTADSAVADQLAAIAAQIEAKAPVDTVVAALAATSAQVTTTTGVSEAAYPPQAPSAQRGAPIYQENCASCHGAHGDGQGADAGRLERKPANFTDPEFMRGETPYDFFHVISVGKRGAAMPAWGEVLTRQERWDVISYIFSLAHSAPQLAEGQGIYLSECAGCHGATGHGDGAYSTVLLTPAPDLTQARQLARRSNTELFATIRDGTPGTAMPAFRGLTDDEAWKATAFVRMLSLGGPLRGADTRGASASASASGPSSATGSSSGVGGTELAETRRLLAAAMSAYRNQQPQALALVSDAYFQFEPLEKKLAVTAPAITGSVESRFLELRGVVTNRGALPEAEALVAAINQDLDAAAAALEPHSNRYTLFVQSATIILREGFEVVLIIGALLASAVKSGTPRMKRPIVAGTIAGLGLSVITAYVFAQVFRGATAGAAEALEGASMLLATVVLFWVSYWLVSKAEAEKWQRFIQGKVKTALSTGSGLALAGAAFLAVYREGVETVLFYQALFGSAAGAAGPVIGGLIAGGAALAVVYVLFVRFGRRIPIRPFFLGTSVLLYYMAIVFAGKGVAELQEAGWIGVTPVAAVPRIDFLGVYPTLETLLAQGVLVGLLLYALGVMLWRRRRLHATQRAAADLQGAT